MIGPSGARKRELIEYYREQADDAERMYEAEGRRHKQRRRLEVLRELVRGADVHAPVVLDAGSGDGHAAAVVLDSLRPAYYLALDLSPAKLSSARERNGGGSIIADMELLPVRAGSVDLVLCSEVLEHLPEPLEALREIRRALRPGGHCLLSTPVDSRLQPWLLRAASALRPWRQERFNEHIQLFTGKSLRGLSAAAGFEIVAERYCGFNFPLLSQVESWLPYEAYRRIDETADRARWGNFGYNGRVTMSLGSEYAVLLLRSPAGPHSQTPLEPS